MKILLMTDWWYYSPVIQTCINWIYNCVNLKIIKCPGRYIQYTTTYNYTYSCHLESRKFWVMQWFHARSNHLHSLFSTSWSKKSCLLWAAGVSITCRVDSLLWELCSCMTICHKVLCRLQEEAVVYVIVQVSPN